MLPTIKIFFERWKWNEAHEIWVSTEGRLRDRYKEPIEIMLNQNGYPIFFDEKKQSFKNVHRVVLETWRPRPDMRELTVEHKDQNKRNPALRNLMWLIEEENNRRGKLHRVNYQAPKQPNSADKRICANGVNMTIEEAVTFIYNSSNLNGQLSKIDVCTKVTEIINSNKEKKCAFGVTFTEVES